MTTYRFLMALWTVTFLALAGPALAQVPGLFDDGKMGQTTEEAPVDITADSLEYLSADDLIVGTGNVEVRDGEDLLRADYVTVQSKTREVYAKGNVVFRRAGKVWQGQELRYNMLTQQGDFGEFAAFVDPFYVRAEDSKRVSSTDYELEGLTLTTCEGERPDFSIRARSARFENNRRVKAKGVAIYFGSVPVMWLPRLNRDLGYHETFFVFRPGYSSRSGVFLLTAFNVRWTPFLRSATHLDYRSEKGPAFGQDLYWKNGTNMPSYDGSVRTYYMDDEKPFRNATEEENEKALVDNERYRIALKHNQFFSTRDYLFSGMDYVSDPELLEDFFDEEYREAVQPENQITLAHQGDNYSLGLLFNSRVNDFYENVNRLPELSLDLQRQQLGDSGFYYVGENALAYLEKVYPELDDEEPYDAFRADSAHTVYYPTRHFGFLNLIPRGGYRATAYSSTYSYSTTTNPLVEIDTNGVASVTNDVNTVITDEGGGFRNLYEIGLESSFKAFRAWEDMIVLDGGDGIRHVAEPYADYTYTPEPNLTPDELPQFDSVDALDRRHDIKLGMRNKLQTRYDKVISDIVDADVYSYLRLEPEDDEEDFSDIYFDADFLFVRRMPITLDGQYDHVDGSFRTFNSAVSYLFTDESSIALEYRHTRDEQNAISAEMVLFPNDRWSFQLYGRWDTEADGLQEHSYYVQRRSRCLGYGIGISHLPSHDEEDDDFRAWFQLWLLALPESQVKMGSS